MQRYQKRRLDGHEHHHKIRRFQRVQLVIAPFGQLVHVAAHTGQVTLHGRLALFLGLRIHRVGVGVQRNLGIDDQVAAAGQVHDHVRPRLLLPLVAVARGIEALLLPKVLALA